MSQGTVHPPLRIRTISFHPDDRSEVSALGTELFVRLTQSRDDPVGESAGIFVSVAEAANQVTPIPGVDILLPTLGSASSAFAEVRRDVARKLAEWTAELGVNRVLPVLAGSAWRNSEALRGLEVVELRPGGGNLVRRRARLQIFDQIRRQLTGRLAFFVSHDPTSPALADVARSLDAWIREKGEWSAFLSRTELPNSDYLWLEDRIRSSGRNAVLLAVRGARPATAGEQREVLAAKAAELPVVTIHVDRSRWQRSDPYGANGPGLRWPVAMETIAEMAVVEWVRSEYFQRHAAQLLPSLFQGDAEDRRKQLEATEVLPRRPELLDAVRWARRSGMRRVFHPDPPLAVHEREVLGRLGADVRFLTPTTMSAPVKLRRLAGRGIALSISVPPDIDGPEGITSDHLHHAMVALARNLLSAAAIPAYAGDFRVGGYTQQLWEAIAAYNETAAQRAELLHVWAPADQRPLERFVVTLRSMANEVTLIAEAYLKPEDLTLQKDASAELRAARGALFLSDLRRVMSKLCEARVLLGGETQPRGSYPCDGARGYGGAFPGVVEEAFWTLKAGKPLYVAGGFGGAARSVVELLRGNDPPELHPNTEKPNLRFNEVAAHFEALRADEMRRNEGFKAFPATLEELRTNLKEMHKLFKSNKAALAQNGLTLAENETLWSSKDPAVISALVLRGLSEKLAPKQARLELAFRDTSGLADVQDLLVLSRTEDASTSPWLDQLEPRLSLPRLALETLDFDKRAERFSDVLQGMALAALDPAGPNLIPTVPHSRPRIGVLALPETFDLDAAQLAHVLWNSDPRFTSMTDSVVADSEEALPEPRATFVWIETKRDRFEALKKVLENLPDVTVWRAPAGIWDERVREAARSADGTGPERGA